MNNAASRDALSSAGQAEQFTTVHPHQVDQVPSHQRPPDARRAHSGAGHVSYPVFAHEPSTLESIKTITSGLRTLPYSLSSTSKHALGPSPPSQSHSTATTYGSFVGPARGMMASPPVEPEQGWPSFASPLDPHSELPPALFPPQSVLPAPAVEEHITWSSWDEMVTEQGRRNLLLLGYPSGLQVWDVTSMDAMKEILNVDVPSFISSNGSWTPSMAIVLPSPSSSVKDEYADARPLLAIIARDASLPSYTASAEVVIYSLRTHGVVKRLKGLRTNRAELETVARHFESDEEADLSTAVTIVANPKLIAISTSRPLAIHLLSASSFSLIHTISSASLTPLSSSLSSASTTPSPIAPFSPRPTFTLTQRLIAFASPPPLPHHRSRNSNPGYQSSSGTPTFIAPALGTLGESVSGGAIALGSGAKKVGEGVWTGMRALSSLAFGSSGNSLLSPASGAGGRSHVGPGSSYPPKGVTPTFFSRSAPSGGHDYSPAYGNLGMASPSPSSASPRSPAGLAGLALRGSSSGVGLGESVLNPHVESAYVAVLDLQPLLSGNGKTQSDDNRPARPVQVAHFLAFSVPTPINMLSFSPSGTLLAVCDVQGKVSKVFQIRGGLRVMRSLMPVTPPPRSPTGLRKEGSALATDGGNGGALGISTGHHAAHPPLSPPLSSMGSRRRSSGASSASGSAVTSTAGQSGGDSVWHLYDLQRGNTHASVETVIWSGDSRWIGIGTAKGTLHVFAINPFGGKPHESSHLDGRVRNSPDLQPLSVTVHPVVRLRSSSPKEGSSPPSFILLPPSLSRSSSVLPSPDPPRSPQGTLAFLKPQSSATSVSPGKTGFQDVLVMNSSNGVLSLRRCTIHPANVQARGAEVDERVHKPTPRGSTSSDMISRSLPLPASGVSMMMSFMTPSSQDAGLRGTENHIASWILKREKDWDNVNVVVFTPERESSAKLKLKRTKSDWLSKAELSTSSKSPNIIPRAVYLSHQFTFYAMHNDWQGLVRRSQLDVPSSKIEVRKEVEITASPAGPGMPIDAGMDDFVLPGSHPQSISSSFDQPLASAMHSHFDAQTGSTVIPSFPNASRGVSNSWRDTYGVPIRSVAAGLSGGVNEGFGRFKKRVSKSRARSPRRDGGKEDNALVFDEEAEAVFHEGDGAQGAKMEDATELLDAPGDVQREASPVHSGVSASTVSTTADGAAIEEHQETQVEPSVVVAADGSFDAEAVRDIEEYNAAVREDARFDDIGVAGFLMEEEERKERERAAEVPSIPAVKTSSKTGAGKNAMTKTKKKRK